MDLGHPLDDGATNANAEVSHPMEEARSFGGDPCLMMTVGTDQ